MNANHIHLLLNHFPIVGTLIGSCLLMWGNIKNQNNYKAIASFILLTMAIIAIPVYLTGEPAEESVEKLAGVSESIIEQHEDAAAFAIWLMIITGAAALIAMVSKWQKTPAYKNCLCIGFHFISTQFFINGSHRLLWRNDSSF